MGGTGRGGVAGVAGSVCQSGARNARGTRDGRVRGAARHVRALHFVGSAGCCRRFAPGGVVPAGGPTCRAAALSKFARACIVRRARSGGRGHGTRHRSGARHRPWSPRGRGGGAAAGGRGPDACLQGSVGSPGPPVGRGDRGAGLARVRRPRGGRPSPCRAPSGRPSRAWTAVRRVTHPEAVTLAVSRACRRGPPGAEGARATGE